MHPPPRSMLLVAQLPQHYEHLMPPMLPWTRIDRPVQIPPWVSLLSSWSNWFRLRRVHSAIANVQCRNIFSLQQKEINDLLWLVFASIVSHYDDWHTSMLLPEIRNITEPFLDNLQRITLELHYIYPSVSGIAISKNNCIIVPFNRSDWSRKWVHVHLVKWFCQCCAILQLW